MTETGVPFKHSTPELYDRYMGPLLFEPYAKVLAARAALLQPNRILETAAGTGIVTRALHRAAPQAQIVATELNPMMLGVAAQNLSSPPCPSSRRTHRNCRSTVRASTSSSASSA